MEQSLATAVAIVADILGLEDAATREHLATQAAQQVPQAQAALEEALPEGLLPLLVEDDVAFLAAALAAEGLGIWPRGAEEALFMIRVDLEQQLFDAEA